MPFCVAIGTFEIGVSTAEIVKVVVYVLAQEGNRNSAKKSGGRGRDQGHHLLTGIAFLQGGDLASEGCQTIIAGRILYGRLQRCHSAFGLGQESRQAFEELALRRGRSSADASNRIV